MFTRSEAIIAAIKSKGYKSYLEIGTHKGETWESIIPHVETYVGVDPYPLHESDNLVRLTSDQFFDANESKFEVIFIDGLHTHEQSLFDLNNAIKALSKDGVIFMHDANPYEALQTSEGVCGGVYQTVAAAHFTRGLHVTVITEDFGVAIITKSTDAKVPFLQMPFEVWEDMKAAGSLDYFSWEVVKKEHPIYNSEGYSWAV